MRDAATVSLGQYKNLASWISNKSITTQSATAALISYSSPAVTASTQDSNLLSDTDFALWRGRLWPWRQRQDETGPAKQEVSFEPV